MKKFMNKSSLALLLTLLMLLSAITVGASLFAVSAEETAEATMTYGDVTKSGNFVDLVAEAIASKDNIKATITLHKDVELQAPIVFRHGRVGTVEGNGHTIYFGEGALNAKTSGKDYLEYLVTFQNSSDNYHVMTFRNVNFSGQPMGWKKGVDEPIVFGLANKGGAAFALHPYQPLTFEDCRIENFYSNNQASVFYYTAIGRANADRNLKLIDTVITNNHALGSTVDTNAAVMRTRNGMPLYEEDKVTPIANTYTAHVYVSGNTYVYDNYDMNGKQANLNLMRAQGRKGNENADNRLYVAENFTGKVGLVGTDFLAGHYVEKEKVDGVMQEVDSCDLPASVIFQGSSKGEDDARMTKVIAVSGTSTQTTHYVIPSATADASGNYPAVKVAACGGARYKLGGSTEWTYVSGNNLYSALNAIKTAGVEEETVLELLEDMVWSSSSGQLSTNDKHFNVVLNGNGHTVNVESHGQGAPMMSLYAGDHVGKLTINDTVFDGGVTVTKNADGTLSFEGTTYAGTQGALIRTYETGSVLSFKNVEIRNFVQTKTGGGSQAGAALQVANNGIAYLDSVNIHDNYSVNNPVIVSSGGSCRIYLNGECSFANNYSMTYSSGAYSLGANAHADIYPVNSNLINIGADFETESLIFALGKVAAGDDFAVLTDGTLNENANLINGENGLLLPFVSGSNLTWKSAPEEVTIVVKTKAGVKAFEYTLTLQGGDALPGTTDSNKWNGVIWNGDANLKTHVAGTKTYTATWAADASTIALYKFYGETEYTSATSQNGIVWFLKEAKNAADDPSVNDNVLELLADVSISQQISPAAAVYFTFDGNGCKITDNRSAGNANAMIAFGVDGSMVAFKNVIFDGAAGATVDPNNADKITFTKPYGAGSGACIRVYGAKNVSLSFTDVEICNYAAVKASGGGYGPVLYLAANNTAKFHNVNIHDNYSAASSSATAAIYAPDCSIYLSGDCTFANNLIGSADANKVFTKATNGDIRKNCTIYIAEDFTTSSIIINDSASNLELGDTIATLTGATLNKGAKIYNMSNDYIGVANGSNVVWGQKGAEKVTVKVMDKKNGTTELLSFNILVIADAALPAWDGAIWNDDPSLKNHVEGTESYKLTWAEGAKTVAVATNGSSGSAYTSLADAAADTSLTRIEILGDFVMDSSFTVSATAKYVMDFNGFVVTRANNGVQINIGGNAAVNHQAKIVNAKFDGKIGGVITANASNVGLVMVNNGAYGFEFDNCEFYDFKSEQGYGVIRTGMPADLTLRDVKMYNNYASQGAIRAHFNTEGYFVLKLAGATEIYNDANDANNKNNVVFNMGAVQIVDDFSGRVELSSGAADGVKVNDVVAVNANYEPYATVAEGAKITGAITVAGSTAGFYAADVNGVLTWVKAGEKIPGVSFKVDENDKLKVYTSLCYYNNGTENVATDKYVSGVYNYFGGEYTLDTTVEAYIPDKIAGDLVTVAAAAADGDTIEIIKSFTTEDVIINKTNVTVNGNGMTLTILPLAKGGSKSLVKVSGAKTVTFNDLTFHGGSPEEAYGKWNGVITAENVHLLDAGSYGAIIYMNNCVVRGQRNVASDTFNGGPIGNSTAVYFFNNCQIIDNIMKSAPNDDGSATASKVSPVLRGYGSSTSFGYFKFEGLCVVKDNLALFSDESGYVTGGIAPNNPRRMLLGDLAEGSEIHMRDGGGFLIAIDPETNLPYDCTGKIVLDGNYQMNEDKSATLLSVGSLLVRCGYTDEADDTNTDAVYKAGTLDALNEYGARFAIYTNDDIEGSKASGGAAITADKFALTLKLPISADYFNTDVVVYVNGVEQSRTPLSSFKPEKYISKSVLSLISVDAVVGMAELTSKIRVEIQINGEVGDFYEITAKTYADRLINMSKEDLATLNVAEESIVPMKSAIAALLQYGQMVQNYFGIDAPAAMDDDDVTLWETLGLTLNMVATSELNTSIADESVKASAEGTLPAGVTVLGSTLTMENQISLRLYFNATDLDGLTFKVNGKDAEVVTTSQGSYIEAAHIGTQNLAVGAVFTISDGVDTYTYTASPMTYVYTVNEAEESNVITANLKKACAALYFYYSAVSEYFDLGFDTTGFTTSATLRLLTDTVNTFSAPRLVTVA